MSTYRFYLEYDGRHSYGHEGTDPADIVSAATLEEAAKKIAKKRDLNYEGYESLMDGDFRTFLYKKQFFKPVKEYVFFVTVEE